MPRVSEDHLQRRRQQIMDAARRCFIRKGFHQTSMQDVFKESGLSAGAVYRYFKSKDEIIYVIATERQGSIVKVLEDLIDEDTLPPLDEIIGLFAERIEALLETDGVLRVAPQVWAEAVHNPALSPMVSELFTDTRTWWVKLAARMRDSGRLPADADLEAVGATLLCLVPGFVLQRLVVKDINADTLRAGFHALTRAQ
jgi:AcrR family transcriptional regulator